MGTDILVSEKNKSKFTFTPRLRISPGSRWLSPDVRIINYGERIIFNKYVIAWCSVLEPEMGVRIWTPHMDSSCLFVFLWLTLEWPTKPSLINNIKTLAHLSVRSNQMGSHNSSSYWLDPACNNYFVAVSKVLDTLGSCECGCPRERPLWRLHREAKGANK